MVLKHFPNTSFYRSVKSKSKRKIYYMTAMHDQLRFLSGIDKVAYSNKNGKRIREVVIQGVSTPNLDALYAYVELLQHEIKYFSGEIGGGRYGELLTDEEVRRFHGRKKYNINTLEYIFKRHPEIKGGRNQY